MADANFNIQDGLNKMSTAKKRPKTSKAQRTINKSNQVKSAEYTEKDARRDKNTKKKTVTNKKGEKVNVSRNTKTGAVTRSKTVTNKRGQKVDVTKTKNKRGTSTLRNNQSTGVKRAKATNAKGRKSTAVSKPAKMNKTVTRDMKNISAQGAADRAAASRA
jgi:hypothetical protein